MKQLVMLLGVVILCAGCTGGGDAGEAPPPRKAMTQAEIDAMPPQARAAMEAAQKRGAQTQETRGQVSKP